MRSYRKLSYQSLSIDCARGPVVFIGVFILVLYSCQVVEQMNKRKSVNKNVFSLNIDYKRPNIKGLSYLALFLTKKDDSGFCWDTRWPRRAHLAMGMLPVSISSAGRMHFNFFSWTMLYSVSMYVFMSSICIKAFIERFYKLMTLWDDFESFIYNFMFLSFGKTQYFYSLGGWLAAKKMSIYHNMWIDFESSYTRKLHRPLVMKSLENYSNRVMIVCITCSLSLIFGQLFTLPYTFSECIGYFPSSTGCFLYLGLVCLNCSALEMASDQLLKNLQQDLQRNPVTRDIIITYKRLWLDLSNLTQYYGVAFFNYSIVIILGTFIDLTVSGFGYLSRLLARIKSTGASPIVSVEELGLIVASVISAGIIIFISNSTHSVTTKVEITFIDELCLAATVPHHPKVLQEIDKFLVMIKNNRPVISLGGYIDLDRKFITKVLTTIVTYWVVLMQFKVGFNQTIVNTYRSRKNR